MSVIKRKREPIAVRVEAFLKEHPGKWFFANVIAEEIGSTPSGVENTCCMELGSKVERKHAVYATSQGGRRIQYRNVFTWPVSS